MDDGLAREGVLTRCNQNREETLNDVECNNVRRASATLALEAERARAPELEQRSEAKLAALREREPQGAAETRDASPSDAPTFGSPVGPLLSSLSPHTIEIDAEPPSNELVIAPPLDMPELGVVPQPFGAEAAQR